MASCSNCGQYGFENKEGFECRKCGFKLLTTVQQEAGTIVYCDTCGCNYWNRCSNDHPTVPVEIGKQTPSKK